MASPASRIAGVDLLRGFAIFFVLMNHVNMRLFLAKIHYTAGVPRQLVSSLVWNGQCGVQIFFAVSGFLITSMAIRRWGSLSRVDVRNFYALRFARIAPLLLLLLAILCALHTAGIEHFVVTGDTGGLGRALVAALTFHVNLLEAQRGYLPASWDILWSLSVEEMFYLFFPLVCWIFGRRTIALVAFLSIFVLLGPPGRTLFAHGNDIWQEYSYLGGMDAIALGCLTAIAISHTAMRRPIIWALGILGAALMIFSLGFSMQAEEWGLARTGLDMTILAIGCCMVIAASAQSGWCCPRVVHPLMSLGQRSYEIYLTHMFVVFALFGLFKSAGAGLFAVPLLFIGVILISGLLGESVARLYSEPMNHRIRRHFRSDTL